MDIGIPGLNGIEITKKISERYPYIKILIQTYLMKAKKYLKLCVPVLPAIF